MRQKLACLFCSTVIISVLFLSAQLVAQQPDGTHAAQILSQSLGVVAPSGATVHDVLLQGTTEFIAGATDETGSLKLQAITDGSSRVDLILPSRTTSESVILSNSKIAGQKLDENGHLHSTALHNLMNDSAWFCPALLLQHLAFYAKLGDVISLGTTEQDGLNVEHLSSSRHVSSGSAVGDKNIERLTKMDLFIDPTSWQPTELRYFTHPEGNARRDIAVSVRYSEYQIFSGVLMPTHVQRYVNGVLALDIHITSATVNNGLAAAQLQLQ